MKFWHKIFIGTLIIFMIAFDAGVVYLTSYSYNFNRRSETDSGIREQDAILASVSGRISSAVMFYPDAPRNAERLAAVMLPLSDFYTQKGVLLALFCEGIEIYSDIPDVSDELLRLSDPLSKNVMEATINDKRHVLIASQLPAYPHLAFVYARDISQIDDFREDVGRVFVILNAVVLVFLGVSVFLLLRRLTKPITEMNTMAAEIADGAFDKRVSVKSLDELGVLADSFNRMAGAVEEHVERLTKAAENRQQFIDDLSHEMRTPLTSIMGYAEYLQNAKSTEEERIIAASHLHYMAKRLKSLSDKLMELTYLRGEKIEMKPVGIEPLFRDLQVSALPLLIPRGVSLVIKPPRSLQVSGDETLLLSLLINLVENAARASKAGSAVTVKAYEDEGSAVIEVSDSGRGIEQENIDRITEPFFREDKSRSREFGGVGLGLSIASQIVALHNARMEINSVPSIGTTVRICFSSFTTP